MEGNAPQTPAAEIPVTTPVETPATPAAPTAPASLLATPVEPTTPVTPAPTEPTAPVAVTTESFTLPEGMNVDKGLLEGFASFASETKIPVEQAQKMVDLFVKQQTEAQQKVEAEHNAQREAWRTEVLARPNAQEQLQHARKALNQLVPEGETRKFFTESWLSDYPPMVDLLSKVGMLLREDSTSTPRAPSVAKTTSGARALFPTMQND